ncbi:Retrovirus-related Pol polyprotein from transposon TNT 1-94 [Gossypium australe]|uniref:Retrovirus-related Pol polyprotein from transposon TNT 1-94 n=1 Tax=Gossypium australe TaxID=47621 RepID=A0A5B6W8V5_9ROSI|nr:Retrovirus-related Pol polyprotein from transposon TNT 1-94 [Gossypium australe]
MSTSGSIFLGESQSISKPPYSNGANYSYWKIRMMLFIQANALAVWDIIMDDPLIPLKQEEELLVLKSNKEWNEEDKRSIQLNAKDKLKVTHEVTSQVKKSKIGILTLNYEIFKMKPEDDIKAMFDRFTIIINGLKSYGKTHLNEELAEIMGSQRVEEAKNENKKVGVALKSTSIEDIESSEEVDEDKEMTMFARRFKKCMRSNRGRKFQKKKGPKFESTNEKDPIICYECKKSGHIKFDCPQWKKNESSKQKLNDHVATWSDEDSSNNEDQEVANLYLMDIDDPKEEKYCFKLGNSSKNIWYLDSGCSKHMTSDKSHFINLKPKSGGKVAFGDNFKRNIEGIGSIG